MLHRIHRISIIRFLFFQMTIQNSGIKLQLDRVKKALQPTAKVQDGFICLSNYRRNTWTSKSERSRKRPKVLKNR